MFKGFGVLGAWSLGIIRGVIRPSSSPASNRGLGLSGAFVSLDGALTAQEFLMVLVPLTSCPPPFLPSQTYILKFDNLKGGMPHK